MSRRIIVRAVQTALLCAVATVSCVRNPPPVVPEPPPPPPPVEERPGPAPRLVPEPPPLPPPVAPPIEADVDIVSRDLEDLNRESPLSPVFFAYDSSRLDGPGRRVLEENAAVLRDNPTWIITIEGHCDERGTAEYNLALGERRALAARQYPRRARPAGRPVADGQLRHARSFRSRPGATRGPGPRTGGRIW